MRSEGRLTLDGFEYLFLKVQDLMILSIRVCFVTLVESEPQQGLSDFYFPSNDFHLFSHAICLFSC